MTDKTFISIILHGLNIMAIILFILSVIAIYHTPPEYTGTLVFYFIIVTFTSAYFIIIAPELKKRL